MKSFINIILMILSLISLQNCKYLDFLNLNKPNDGTELQILAIAFAAGAPGAPSASVIDTNPPSVPSGLRSSNLTAFQMDLTWEAASDDFGVVGYKVYKDGIEMAEVTSTSFTASGLTQNTTYNFRVLAYDKAGNVSSLSSSLSELTPTISVSVFYMAPTGNNAGDGSYSSPFKTFGFSFSQMAAGDILVLKNGKYTVSENGLITYLDSPKSGQIPSGLNRAFPTTVMAETRGQVLIDNEGGLAGYHGHQAFFVGRSTRKDSFIKIQGLRFKGSGALFNSQYVVVKDCGFNGRFGMGTSDHDNGNTHNLIEDSWIFNHDARVASINYRADKNVWRRVVIRSEGCDEPGCLGSGNPNVGFSVYESEDVTVENVIILDRVLNGGYPYGDFASAQHTIPYMTGNNVWLGNISFNSEDSGFHLENDQFNDFTYFLSNNLAVVKANASAFNIGDGSNIVVENNTAIALNKTSGSLIRFYDNVISMSLENNLIYGNGTWGAVPRNHSQCSYNNVFGTFSDSRYHGSNCSTGDLALDPVASGSLLYPLRIESGSPLSGTAKNGKDYGANIIYRYGQDGAIFGDANLKTLTNVKLWPWPNEALIRADFCEGTYLASVGRTGANTPGLCASGKSLTRYLWEYLGNSTPAEML